MQLKLKLEETRSDTNTLKNIDPTKVCARDGSYYIGQIIRKYFCEDVEDSANESNLSPSSGKAKEERCE